MKRIASIVLAGASTLILTACGTSIPNLNGNWTFKNTSDGTSGVLQLKEDNAGALNGQLSANNENDSLSGVVDNKGHVNMTFNENGKVYKFDGNVANGSIVGTVDGSTWEATRSTGSAMANTTVASNDKQAQNGWQLVGDINNVAIDNDQAGKVTSLTAINGVVYVSVDYVDATDGPTPVFAFENGSGTALEGINGNESQDTGAGAIANYSNTLYIANSNGVYSYDNHAWHEVGSDLSSKFTPSSFLNANGTWYVAGDRGVAELQNGSWLDLEFPLTANTGDYVDQLVYAKGVLYVHTHISDEVYGFSNGKWSKICEATQIFSGNNALYVEDNSTIWEYQNGKLTQKLTLPNNADNVVYGNGKFYAQAYEDDKDVISCYTNGKWIPLKSQPPYGLDNFWYIDGTLYGTIDHFIYQLKL